MQIQFGQSVTRFGNSPDRGTPGVTPTPAQKLGQESREALTASGESLEKLRFMISESKRSPNFAINNPGVLPFLEALTTTLGQVQGAVDKVQQMVIRLGGGN